VVAEDDWWGSRAPGQDVALRRVSLGQRGDHAEVLLDTASPGVYPAQAREAWLKEHALAADLDGVVFYLPPSDHQLGGIFPD